MKWTKEESLYSNIKYTETAPTKLGNDCLVNNAIEIVCKTNINGSGDEAFGGAKEWPVIKCEVPFCTGEEEKAQKFYDKLKKFIEENI